ncbi:MAG TPA: acyl-phosphate glycerol 3-phosphate acyltransferase [Candidatus Cloacimonas sp.]|jgi:glycerol-3-phosphate acyltransferase PlsY|nr:acyl phosphate:glycerol-3-phosphate acyltransferase [Candidatus Cloacimonadota bacterium]HCX73817.1 acyl-phosphate glycerol 3-phosphate acyltransferase [Candidatus Cloacimonas sp.]
MAIIFLFIAAYLIGSFPTSFVMGKLIRGLDIRQYGSGNVGATNALRVLGTKIGLFTLLVDIGKGFLTIFLVRKLLPEASNLFFIGIGLTTILGHIFSIFLKFKGGKGVATSAGVFLALTPLALALAFAVFVIVVAITHYVSLGSILAAITLLVTELVINLKNSFSQLELLIFVFIVALFIITMHRSNITRLLAGNENKLSFKK